MLSMAREDGLHFARLQTVQNTTDPPSPHFRLETDLPLRTNAHLLSLLWSKRHPERPISALPNEVRPDADSKVVVFKQLYFSFLAVA